MVGMGDKPEVGRLVRASLDGDQAAWNELVRLFTPRVMAVIRTFRFTDEDAQDLCQTVWLRAVEHLAELREPEALPGWLRRIATNECTRLLDRRRRTVPVDPQSDEAMNRPGDDDIEAAAIRAEFRQALRDGFAELSAEDRALLRMYALAQPYKDVSELLQMKTGSIGPTIGRSLDRLRETRALRRYLGTTPAAKKRRGGDQLELAPLD
jgi:RNA polymerase sigma factor (sigma-70 family)